MLWSSMTLVIALTLFQTLMLDVRRPVKVEARDGAQSGFSEYLTVQEGLDASHSKRYSGRRSVISAKI